MTKSTGVGRGAGSGGKRPGAGRPRSPPSARTIARATDPILAAKDAAARHRTINAFDAASRPGGVKAATLTSKDVAETYAIFAVQALAEITLVGDRDAARVSAAWKLLQLSGHAAPQHAPARAEDERDEDENASALSWNRILAN